MIPLLYIIVGVGAIAAYLLMRDDGANSITIGESIVPHIVNPVSALEDATPCGIDGIDRLPLAQLVAEEFGTHATIAHARSMVGIAYCETEGKSDAPVIGDTTYEGGPSIGPLQVTRATAIDLSLVPKNETRETYKARAYEEMWCLRAGVKVFASKLLTARGDFPDAIRRYNGSGSRADQYKQKALSFLAETFGDNWQTKV